MSEPNANNDEHKLEYNPNPTVNSGNTQADTEVQTAENTQQQSHKAKAKPPIYKRVFTFITNQKNQPLIANCISALMLAVTAILAYYTWQLFTQTTIQSKAATDAAKAANNSVTTAQQTLKADTEYNNKTIENQRIADIKGDDTANSKYKRDTATFNLQKRSVQSQIEAFKKTQEQYEITNQPFLQFQLDTTRMRLKGDQIIKFFYKVNPTSERTMRVKGFI